MSQWVYLLVHFLVPIAKMLDKGYTGLLLMMRDVKEYSYSWYARPFLDYTGNKNKQFNEYNYIVLHHIVKEFCVFKTLAYHFSGLIIIIILIHEFIYTFIYLFKSYLLRLSLKICDARYDSENMVSKI